MRFAELFEQPSEFEQLGACEMSQLSLVHLPHVILHRLQQTQALLSDPYVYNSPIFTATATFHKSSLFEPVEHASGVRAPRNEPTAKRQRLQTVRVSRTQQPQCVVLLS